MADLFNEEQQKVFNEELAKKQEQWRRKYEGYLSPDDFKNQTADLNKQIADLTKALEDSNKQNETFKSDIADRDSKIKAYETHSVKTRIAHEAGLGYEAIDFLKGDDEESIKSSAEALKSLMGTSKLAPPVVNEPPVKEQNSSREAAKKLVQSLKNNNN